MTHESVQQHLQASVEGTSVDFTDTALSKITDVFRVRKIYKLDTQVQAASKKAKEKDPVNEEAERKELEVNVLGLMALRGMN